MDISVIVQFPDKSVYELREVISAISWATTLDAQPGKIKFAIPIVKEFAIPLGSTINVIIEDTKIFYGYIFECRMSDKDTV